MTSPTPAGTEVVTLRREGAVAWVTLDRPEAGNAINQHVAAEFRRIVLALVSDRSCRVLVLGGNGKLFCAGGDVAAMWGAEDQPTYLAMLARTIHEALVVLAESRLIVVAAVNGPAAGAGLGLVLNADLVIAGPDAVFLAAYAGVGLTPDCGVSWLLSEVVGPRRAAELALTGKALSVQEALEWGLVNEVVADLDALERRVRELAEQLSSAAGDVLGRTKKLLTSRSSGYAQHLEAEANAIVSMIVQPETQARLAAFAERADKRSRATPA